MRKTIISFALVLLLLSICSCGLAKTHTAVLEVREAQLNSDELKHSYDADGDPVVSINDRKRGDKKTVEFRNKQYDLEYTETISYVIGDVCVDEYAITGNNGQGKILLLPDGEIYAILLSSIGQIEIESTAEALTVRQAVEAYLKEEFDFGSFKYCDATCSLPDISDGFGLYSFVWYNKIGDIGTDQTLNISVRQNGEMGALWMKYRSKNSFAGVSDSISISDYEDRIRNKLEDIYGDGLIAYSVIFSVLTHYNDKPYIDCTISVNYRCKNAGAFSEACRLLIPAE